MMEAEYGIRHYMVALLFILIVLGSWILVIGHQFDLGALNLGKSETWDALVLGAYCMTVVSVAFIGAMLLAAWVKF